MKYRRRIVLSCVSLSISCNTTFSQVFQGVSTTGSSNSSLALAISEDGSTVVGRTSDFQTAWRWQVGGGLTDFGPAPDGYFLGSATDVSSSGDVVVGAMSDGMNTVSWRWTSVTGAQQVPGLTSQSPRISSNSLVISGDTPGGFGTVPARWSAATGVVPIPDLSGLPAGRTGFITAAAGLTADGSMVVGTGRVRLDFPTQINVPYFSSGTTATAILNAGNYYLPPGGSAAFDVSADGSVIVGSDGLRLWRWTLPTGFQLLATPSNTNFLEPRVSANGLVAIFGDAYWSQGVGTRTLTQTLADAACNFAGWTGLVATDLSGNGQVLCGYGTNPQGLTEGWYATIPSPGVVCLLCGVAILTRRRRKH